MRRSNKVTAIRQTEVNVSFHELWNMYHISITRKGLSPYTIKHELENFKAMVKYVTDDTDVSSFTSEDFEVVFDEMRKKGLTPTTINGRIKTLRRMLDFAVKHELLAVNHGNKVEKMKNVDTPIHSLTLEQINLLLGEPDTQTFVGLRNRTMIELALDTGIRLREMLDLTVDQVDLKNRSLKNVYRKTRKVTDIPMSRKMVTQLQRYLKERGSDGSVLFLTIDDGPIHRRTFQDHLSQYAQRANIQDVRVSPHTLRHTFAKFWILNGGDPFSLQHMLGHTDMNMVRRYVTLWGHELQDKHDQFSPLAKLTN